MLMLMTLFLIKKDCVKSDFLDSLDLSLLGVVFLFFPVILITLDLSGTMNAYAYDTFFGEKKVALKVIFSIL